jgi:hypothetical protein
MMLSLECGGSSANEELLMNKPACLAAFVGMAAVPMVHATADRLASITDESHLPGAVVWDHRTFVGRFVTSLIPSISYSQKAVSHLGLLSSERDTADVPFGVRYDAPPDIPGSGMSSFSTNKSDVHPVSTLDVGLMLLFAAGLLGIQLRRKQKALRHSSLLAI